MSKTARLVLVSIIVIGAFFMAWKAFYHKDYTPDVNEMLRVENLVAERDEILKLHKSYIKALYRFKSRVKTIGERYFSRLEGAKTFKKTGELFQKNQLWKLAQKNYETGLAIFPRDSELHYKLGLVYANMGLLYFQKVREYWKKAEAHYLKAIKYNPNLKRARYALALLYLNYFEKNINKTFLSKALTQLGFYISKNPQDPKAYFVKARVLYHQENYALAQEAYQTILGLSRKSSASYRNAYRNIKLLQQKISR